MAEGPAPLTVKNSSSISSLGRSHRQRSSEILAGIRAELLPKPEYAAMARPAGRMLGSLLVRLSRRDQPRLNAVIARPEVFRYLVAQMIKGKAEAHHVELAAGFVPRAWQLASEFPQLRVTEVDLPEIIAEKQRRLARTKLGMPSNLKMLSADFGAEALAETLGGEKADVITAEGLLPHSRHAVIESIAVNVRECLKADGVFIADIITKESYRAMTQSKIRHAIDIFRRNVGEPLGLMDDFDHARKLFASAGYSKVEIQQIPELAERLPHVPKPVAVITSIVIART